eukprot:366136-Chlamydomonas_euryale.AAC.3
MPGHTSGHRSLQTTCYMTHLSPLPGCRHQKDLPPGVHEFGDPQRDDRQRELPDAGHRGGPRTEQVESGNPGASDGFSSLVWRLRGGVGKVGVHAAYVHCVEA